MYLLPLLPLALLSFNFTLTLATPILQRRTTCSSLHVIVARGTCESSTTVNAQGSFYQIADLITSQINGSDSVGLVYPATGISNCPTPTYNVSEPSGVTVLTADIKAYAQECPDSRIALVGYSQGGQVVGDVVCGTSESGFPATVALPHKYAKQIVAAIIFGDPGHVINESYDRGNATLGLVGSTSGTGNGTAPRTTTAACRRFAPKLRSYCNADDEFCASGTSVVVHDSYIATNGAEGVAFVVAKYEAALKKKA